MSFQIRYRNVGELIGTAFRLGWRFFPLVLLLSAAVAVLSPINSLILFRIQDFTANLDSVSRLSFFIPLFGIVGALFLYLVVQTLYEALLEGMFYGELHRYALGHEGPFRLARALPQALKRMIALALAGFLYNLIISTGFLVLIVPGCFLISALAVIKPLVICEGLNPLEALERSWKLTRGYRLKIFGTLLLCGLIAAVPIGLIYLGGILLDRHYGEFMALRHVQIVQSMITGFLYSVVGFMLGHPVYLLIYYNLRVAKEGSVDTAITAEFDRPMPGAEL